MDKYCPKCFKKYQSETARCPDDGTNLVTLDDRDLTGQVLDERYTVLDRIGKGGMGVVYRAEQQLIKRIVALKVLRSEVVQDESSVKRFLVEAQAIASLTSRYTVTLHDFGVTHDGFLYYTMELLKGRPLSQVIREEAPIEHGRAVRLVLQVCDSLEEAHEHGILHRDIKPDNLFVERDRQGSEEIRVLDFGIAKLVGDSSVESVTKTGLIVGTPQYLSPEQALGNPCVPASDLYSLGVVLYEMLAGAPPFGGDTPIKMLLAHIQSPVPRLQVTNPNVVVPKSIELFLAKALEKNPLNRFQSAIEFREALQGALVAHETTHELAILSPMISTQQGLRERSPSPPGPTPTKGGVDGGCVELAETSVKGEEVDPPDARDIPGRAASATSIGKPRGRLAWGLGIAAAVVFAALAIAFMSPWATGNSPATAGASSTVELPASLEPTATPPPQQGDAEVDHTDVSRQAKTEPSLDVGVAARVEPAASKAKPGADGATATVQSVETPVPRAEIDTTRTGGASTPAEADPEAVKKAQAKALNRDLLAREAAAKEAATRRLAAEEATRKAEEVEAAKTAKEAARKAALQTAQGEAQKEALRKKKEEEARKRQEEEAQQAKIRDLSIQGSQALKARRWKQCAGYFEEVVRLGGSTPEVVERLEKCRQMQTFDGGESK